MNHAAFGITDVKALGDGPQGLFAARVSMFNNVDRNGDRMLPGAFAKSLDRWRQSSKLIPVIWSHDHKDPKSYIGSVDPSDVKETKDGLVVAGKLDIESNERAREIYELMRKGLVSEWSFAYEVKEERIADDLARELLEVDLFEVGPVLVGANNGTATLALKEAVDVATADPELDEKAADAPRASQVEANVSATLDAFETQLTEWEQKVGRAISAKTEAQIRNAMGALQAILAALSEDTEQASATPEVKQEPTPVEDAQPATADHRRELDRIGLFLSERGRSS